ncbi:MAG: DNA-binding protein [Alphaproteobacteria bacterium]|nr:MAG: DNA-binding protein [Alphaproteobacteria bacterium]
MTSIEETTAPDLVWGCAAIAEVIGRTERATFHLLKSQLLPARRVGGRWCASRRKLIETLTGDGAPS